MPAVEFIFGGTFDPIHNGHINILESLQRLCPQWPIRILPCAVPVLKKTTGATFEQRVEMIKLATEKYTNLNLDLREGERQGKSYTIDSVRELRQEHPDRRFILVIGSDNLDYLEQWHQCNQLVRFCHLLVVNRPASKLHNITQIMKRLGFEMTTELSELVTIESGVCFSLQIEEKDISSTHIRKNLHVAYEPLMATPKAVQKYIKDNLIYQ